MSSPTFRSTPNRLSIVPRTAILASSDSSFRERVRETLCGLRWHVKEAGGAAEAWAHAESSPAEAMIVDTWLPDLEVMEFISEFRQKHPDVELVTVDGVYDGDARSPRRSELLYAVRRGQDAEASLQSEELNERTGLMEGERTCFIQEQGRSTQALGETFIEAVHLPEFVGNSPEMLEVSRRIRLVAPRSTAVLVQGPTGTGKELVARALHRLSPRSRKPFVALNCAAIPEALLEAELFGHTRGAFTGAVQGRTGRIEAANGGTLFLDEIGEMPLPLQAKLLRFLESGELQRVGDNDSVKVDVRVVAATHQPLAQRAKEGSFRADLYYRLAVFLLRTPSLFGRVGDVERLIEHFLRRMAEGAPVKRLTAEAHALLLNYSWPGNVRELEHTLERAAILAGDRSEITAAEIEFTEDVA